MPLLVDDLCTIGERDGYASIGGIGQETAQWHLSSDTISTR